MEKTVDVPVDEITVIGDLCIPKYAKGIVVFAHGSGSSRHSTRNKQVARILQETAICSKNQVNSKRWLLLLQDGFNRYLVALTR